MCNSYLNKMTEKNKNMKKLLFESRLKKHYGINFIALSIRLFRAIEVKLANYSIADIFISLHTYKCILKSSHAHEL